MRESTQSDTGPADLTAHWRVIYVRTCVLNAYHADVEGIEQVKGQSGDQIHKEPGCGVVDADGAGIIHHLTGGADIGGSEVQHDICHTSHNCITHQ